MKALIDGDILRYEIGFAAEAGWRATTGDEEGIPPWEWVEASLHGRLDEIEEAVNAKEMKLFLTDGPTFRDQIATKKEYKGTRIAHKPWHFSNLTTYIKDVLGADVSRGIEADDAIAIEHTLDPEGTIVCSRDKDFFQLPGWHYSWELGKQPAWGPAKIDHAGSLMLTNDRKKLTGTGMAFFYAQCLMGDTVDNIPGLPGCGPVAAFGALTNSYHTDFFDIIKEEYMRVYGDSWKTELLEQGRLLWLVRRLDEDGRPVMWELGMEQ